MDAREIAAALAECAAAGKTVRARGAGTKWDWGGAREPDVVLSTAGLDGIEHVAGDLTAVLGAGVRLADAQAVFAEAGQRHPRRLPDARKGARLHEIRRRAVSLLD